MVAKEAPSAPSSGVVVFYRVVEQLFVQALQTYEANVVSFQLALGDRWWYMVFCNLALDDTLNIEDVLLDIAKQI